MPYKPFVWDPDNDALHIDAIDQQHEHIFHLANIILALPEEPVPVRKVILEHLHLMANYVLYHFDEEENLLQQYGYEHLEEHKAEHEQFRTNINAFVTRCETEDTPNYDLLQEVKQFTYDWVLDHTRNAEVKTVTFLRTRGGEGK